MDRRQHDHTDGSHDAFIAELRHWREVAGHSQKALARMVGYTPSYVNKVERGSLTASREFVKRADRSLQAGNAILRRWMESQRPTGGRSAHGTTAGDEAFDPQSAPSTALIVEHEQAHLAYVNGVFRTRVQRRIRNVGAEPVTQYLIRIAVDRHPGDPERSNQLYRDDPLTWEEIALSATCGDEPMTWRVKHDRDAFKELWLLFENAAGRFPLYPGETVWLKYVYKVNAAKWGPWWQRAVRLPTRRLSLTLDLPADLDPNVWGMETSMTAEATPFRSPINRETQDDRALFTWSTDNPPLHTRFRLEWRFKAASGGETTMTSTQTPVEAMTSLGIVQEQESILTTPAEHFRLPAEADDARRVVAQLVATLQRVTMVHTFAKGVGLAAPQIGISRSAAVIRTPDGETLTLLNPRVIDESTETTEQYEGCLSFFDVRGMVPRPIRIEVEHQDAGGHTHITAFERGLARLVAHEIDHLDGRLYRSRMRPEVPLIPVSQYTGTGHGWDN
jgi:peptide deformylase